MDVINKWFDFSSFIEKLAKKNEQLAKENEQLAKKNEQLAKENEQLATELDKELLKAIERTEEEARM